MAACDVANLISRLPLPLHEPLRGGMAAAGGDTTRMSVDEFLDRLVERTGVATSQQAFVRACAVIATLREAAARSSSTCQPHLRPG